MRKLLEALISVPATFQYGIAASTERKGRVLEKSISEVTYLWHAVGCVAGGIARWSSGVARHRKRLEDE